MKTSRDQSADQEVERAEPDRARLEPEGPDLRLGRRRGLARREAGPATGGLEKNRSFSFLAILFVPSP